MAAACLVAYDTKSDIEDWYIHMFVYRGLVHSCVCTEDWCNHVSVGGVDSGGVPDPVAYEQTK